MQRLRVRLARHFCLQEFMTQHDFTSIEGFRGASLPYFTTHTELVRMQREAIAAKRARTGLAKDDEWEGAHSTCALVVNSFWLSPSLSGCAREAVAAS